MDEKSEKEDILISDMESGIWCQKRSIDQVIEEIRKKHGDNVSLKVESYAGTGKHALFVDTEYGEWRSKVSHVMNGSKHPRRSKTEVGVKRRIPLCDFKEKLFERHGKHVAIIESSYTMIRERATFIDEEHGEFTATPNNVLKGNCHPYCHRHKQMVSSSMCTKETHWKTGAILYCTGGYEVAFVRWCNHHKIDFMWQITHVMPDGKTYRVDAKILDGLHADKWIEIKGFFRGEVSRRKWEWFHEEHPRSELWDGQLLSKLGVLAFHPNKGSKVEMNLSQDLVIDLNP